jgi:Fur family peroxide stress response transcriptional regulator
MNDYEKLDAAVIDALRKKGYKATPQRITICRFALHSREHPSVQRIYDEVRKIHPTVSLATVYKTLEVLKELHKVQELNFPRGQTRFDPRMQPHINLVCLRCGNITDLDDFTARAIVEKVVSTTKFAATGQRLDIYGICQKCSSSEITAASTNKKEQT